MERLTDLEARIVAAWWQSGGQNGLASLASSGAITDDVLDEIEDIKRFTEHPEHVVGLDALAHYCRHHGPRGPVDGWGHVSWSGTDERHLEAKLRNST